MVRRGLVSRAAPLLLAAIGVAKPCFAGDPAQDLPDTSTAEVQRCVEAHDNARVLMLEEKWLEAREGMNRCQDASCPLAIRSDCAAWLEEVTRILPTLLVVVERDDDGKTPVDLDLDGRRLELPNPPHPIEVLPGTHLLRVNLGGYPPVERVVVLSKGDKNHVVRVRFAREPTPAPLAPAPSQPKPERSRPIPATTYALAGGAVAALATSGILLASALTSRNDALDRCAPVCTENEQDSIDARLLAADVFGTAGIVLGGFAVYTFLNRPTVEQTAAFVPKLQVSRGGGSVSLEGRF
jgi:hypothetical protein